jgi:plasmid replication initiation protein
MARLSKDIEADKKKPLAFTKISNDLVEAFVKKSNLTALKILFYIARSEGKLPKSELIKITIDTDNLCSYCNISPKTLKKNLVRMQETSISITDENAESYMSVLPKVSIPYGSKKIEIKIFREVLQLIWSVKGHWTSINVEQLMTLGHKHSVRMIMLLEMISGFHYKKDIGETDIHDNPMPLRVELPKVKEYSLEELNALFGTNYKRLGQFEQSILKPIKEELDQNSKLTFTHDIKYDKKPTARGRSKAVGIRLYPAINNP